MTGYSDQVIPARPEALEHPVQPDVSVIVIGWGAAPLLVDCLQAVTRIETTHSVELIVTLNEPDPAVLSALSASGIDATLVTSRVNRGFGGACNAGAAVARGRFLLFLNDDTVVDRHWLQTLVSTAEAHPNAGAVGGRCLHLDGSVQEAGNFLWSDGTTSSSTGDLEGLPHRYDFARKVDYCSAASLLVRRPTFEAVGGFDERYFPAYYEDLDLCLKIREAGQDVWFQPASTVHHVRSASTTRPYREFLMHRNRALLVDRWRAVLADRVERSDDPVDDEERAAWIAMGRPDRILVIDDRVPEESLGSGFGRMVDTLSELLADEHHHVTLYPHEQEADARTPLAASGLRVLHGDLADHLERAATHYDVVVISRPHNYARYGELVRRTQPQAAVVYDAEALYFRRTELQASLETDPVARRRLTAEAEAMRADEERFFADADLSVCISDSEAEFARSIAGTADIRVIPADLKEPSPTVRPFDERSDVILVASWLAGPDSPNADGLRWFVAEVLPLLRELVPWVRVRVTGANPPADLVAQAGAHLTFVGRVSDLHDFYDRGRVAIAPIRFGAGVKLKTMEALQYCIPTVTTSVGGEGIDTMGTGALRIADDPGEFARAVAELVDDPVAWTAQYAAGRELLDQWSVTPRGSSWTEVLGAALRIRRVTAAGYDATDTSVPTAGVAPTAGVRT